MNWRAKGYPDDDELRRLAIQIDRVRTGRPGTRPIGNDSRFVGLVGERAVAAALGLPYAPEVRARGNAGRNLTLPNGWCVNVVTRRRQPNGRLPDLAVTRGTVPGADVHVLVIYDDGPPITADVWGWTSDAEVRSRIALPLAAGDGSLVHLYPVGKLRTMRALLEAGGMVPAQVGLFS